MLGTIFNAMTRNEDIILVSHYTNSEHLTIVMGSQALAFPQSNLHWHFRRYFINKSFLGLLISNESENRKVSRSLKSGLMLPAHAADKTCKEDI